MKNDNRDPAILWPTITTHDAVVDPAMLTPAPAPGWPLLLDIDAITANTDPPDACCWPPLDDVPLFSERWQAMPSAWFMVRR